MITLISVKRRDTCGSIRGVVIGEFGDRKERIPVVLLVGAVHAEVLLKGLVSSLGLTISLRMMAGGEMEVNL